LNIYRILVEVESGQLSANDAHEEIEQSISAIVNEVIEELRKGLRSIL